MCAARGPEFLAPQGINFIRRSFHSLHGKKFGFVCSQWSGSYHFILNLDSNKEIRQCLVQGTVLGHYKTLNVA